MKIFYSFVFLNRGLPVFEGHIKPIGTHVYLSVYFLSNLITIATMVMLRTCCSFGILAVTITPKCKLITPGRPYTHHAAGNFG